jgi:hypothetical protein
LSGTSQFPKSQFRLRWLIGFHTRLISVFLANPAVFIPTSCIKQGNWNWFTHQSAANNTFLRNATYDDCLLSNPLQNVPVSPVSFINPSVPELNVAFVLPIFFNHRHEPPSVVDRQKQFWRSLHSQTVQAATQLFSQTDSLPPCTDSTKPWSAHVCDLLAMKRIFDLPSERSKRRQDIMLYSYFKPC